MGFLFALLSVVCSLTIAQILKVVRNNDIKLIQVLGVNYLVAALISFVTNSGDIPSAVELGFIPLAAILVGGIFIANLFVYSASIHKIGMGISIAAMRMSLIIPIGLSLWLFEERITSSGYAGIILVFIAFFLMLPKTKEGSIKSATNWIYPLLLFVFTGIADGTLKFYERRFSGILSEELFLSFIFVSSFIVSVVVLIAKKDFRFTIKQIFYGIGVGVANLYSSFFLLLALRELPGALVFSLVNISNVLLGTVIGLVYWKDSLTFKQKTGIVLAATSIVLLLV